MSAVMPGVYLLCSTYYCDMARGDHCTVLRVSGVYCDMSVKTWKLKTIQNPKIENKSKFQFPTKGVSSTYVEVRGDEMLSFKNI